MLKEIKIEELNNYIDSVSLFKNGAITLVYDKEQDKYNPMTIGWGGLGVLWSIPTCTVYIHKVRYSKYLFDNEEYFSVSIPLNEDNLRLYGTKSGRDTDKIKDGNDTIEVCDNIPYIKESKLVILCKKIGQTDMDINNISIKRIVDWYSKDGVHTCYFGQIVKVLINE